LITEIGFSSFVYRALAWPEIKESGVTSLAWHVSTLWEYDSFLEILVLYFWVLQEQLGTLELLKTVIFFSRYSAQYHNV
jgi:hypothetical protein